MKPLRRNVFGVLRVGSSPVRVTKRNKVQKFSLLHFFLFFLVFMRVSAVRHQTSVS